MIGIVGLGLIGGSIYKSLQGMGIEVIGISNSQNGVEENITNDLTALKDCEMVFVATPMNKTLEMLDKLEDILDKKTIVTDVCSLKEFVCKKQRPYKFIPSHPMAGTEFQGFENSFDGLFLNAKWILTPIDNTDTKKLKGIIQKLGAKPVITTPKEHDEAVALISHMPMVVAQALFDTVKDNELAQKLASSGFRDMTRLALSGEEMACDMVELNSKNIQYAILKLYSSIGEITKANYRENIKQIKKNRQDMYENGINIIE